MKRLIHTNTYNDEVTFAPIIHIIYYDSNFIIHEVKVKTSREFIEDLKAQQVVLDAKGESDLTDTLIENHTVIEQGVLDVGDVDIVKYYNEYLGYLNNKITIKRYDDMYHLRLNNIKQLRRQKNLHDLGV